MSMENKEMTGVMFPHEKKNPKQPDFKGSIKIGGVDYEIAAWNRTSKSNLPYMSLMVAKKGERQAKAAAPAHTPKETVEHVAKAVGGSTELQSNSIYEEVPF